MKCVPYDSRILVRQQHLTSGAYLIKSPRTAVILDLAFRMTFAIHLPIVIELKVHVHIDELVMTTNRK